MKNERAKALSLLYQSIHQGDEWQYKHAPGTWGEIPAGLYPHLHSDLDYYRRKPIPIPISYTNLVESSIDCEFWDVPEQPALIAPLSSINHKNPTGSYRPERRNCYFKRCRPRMDHWHSWRGESDSCPIPEGFIVRYELRNGMSRMNDKIYRTDQWDHSGKNEGQDVIAFKIERKRDDYCWPWENE